jgi:hypothetical protein
MSITATSSIAHDWIVVKTAHTAATDQVALARGWMPEAARPWLDRLTELALAFEGKHGIEFDPKKPITEKEAA